MWTNLRHVFNPNKKVIWFCWKVKHCAWFVISISIGSQAWETCCPTLLYSSLHFHSFAVLITIKVSTPGNIRGDKSPKLVPGTSPTVLTTQSNRSWPKMWSVPCCKGIAVGTNPWDFSLRVSNQNCTLNIFEWYLRRGRASSGNKTWRENTTAGLFVIENWVNNLK